MTELAACIVHIGLHKTGTTSIQRFLQEQRGSLKEFGYNFYQGMHIAENHVELHAATMRPDRPSTYRLKSGLVFDETYLQLTLSHVRDFLNQAGSERVVFSAEGLSLLRYVDEVEQLASLLPPNICIVAYLRCPVDYLRSHSNQLKKSGMLETVDKTSYAYMGADSWMLDYELRLKAFRTVFGHANVHVVDYDKACALDGSVIPSFLRLLDLEDRFSVETWQGIRLNQS